MKTVLSLAAAVVLQSALYAQVDPQNFTNNNTTSTTMLGISPDGTRVLAQQGGFYGTIPWGGGAFQSLGLPTLSVRNAIWDTNSQGVFFAEEVISGTTVTVNLRRRDLNLSTTNVLMNTNPPVRLFLVDRQRAFLYGTQTTFVAGVQNELIVRVPLAGPPMIQQLRTISGGTISEMDIDPSGTRLLMLFLPQGGPFIPSSVLSMPSTGLTAPVTLATNWPIQNIGWTNGQSRAVFAFRNAAVTGNNFLQIGAVDVASPGTIIPLTGGRRDHDKLGVSNDQSLLAFEVRDGNTGTTPSFEDVAAVMPASGGGEVLLMALRRFDMLGGSRMSINTSANVTRVAYAAREFGVDNFFQVYGQSVGNDITVTPAARLGAVQTITFQNQGAPFFFIAVMLNLTRVNASGPPVAGPILVDPNGALAVVGITNAPIGTGSLTVPTDPVFIDVNLYFQAITGLPNGLLLASRMVEAAVIQ